MELPMLLVLLLVSSIYAQDEEALDNSAPKYLRRPPKITRGPEKHYVYVTDATQELPCEATGVPDPEYTWMKDGVDVKDLNRKPPIIWNQGTIILHSLSSLDEGTYQCFASNQNGKSMSKKAMLNRALIGNYPADPKVEEKTATRGEKLKLICDDLKIYPEGSFNWVVSKQISGTTGDEPVTLGPRIQMDENGHLYFANVVDGDERDGWLYKCNIYNSHLVITKGGSFTRVTVNPGSPPPRRPMLEYQTESPVIGIGGHDVSMKCLYSGNPTPTVDWRRKDGSLPFGRFEKSNSGTTITLKALIEEDEGIYICYARSGNDEEQTEVHLVVDWEPKFENSAEQPSDHNATEDDMVVFKCRTFAEPDSDTQWYINGIEIYEGDTTNPRYTITEGGRALELQKVCKDCPDAADSTDLMNVQCNSSNKHAYAYADAYLNILLKTEITLAPEDVEFEWNAQVEFKCEATSDDSTPVHIIWEKDDIPIIYEPGRIEMTQDNTLLIITENDEDSGKSFEGKYTCIADNEYSTKHVEAFLTLPAVIAPIKKGGIGDMWWIFVIIAIILLLLILLCCCCLCIQRNKGDSYPVDEKERANGNDPEKELADSGFSDYQRPEDAPIKGSRASLSSTIKLDSEDEGSLNEYGDIDTGKFNEDGSFIGQYIEKDKKRPKDSDV